MIFLKLEVNQGGTQVKKLFIGCECLISIIIFSGVKMNRKALCELPSEVLIWGLHLES